MQLKHYKELDGVRGIAALMVMFFHFFSTLQPDNSFQITLKKFAIFGQTGVSLFFVLSGFLITRILLNSKDSAHFFLNFYMRRMLRIFPLYYFFLFFYYFIWPTLEGIPRVEASQQIYFWVYLQNFAMTFNWNSVGPSHFWSLAVEEHFYLFWPLIIYFFDKKWIKIIIVLILISAFVTRYILLINNYEVFYFTFSRMDELALGALLAVFEMEGLIIQSNSKKFLILFALVGSSSAVIWTGFSGIGSFWLQFYKFILLAFAYFALIGFLVTAKDSHLLKRMSSLKLFRFSGKISYGLYVYHPLCFWLVHKFIFIDSILVDIVLSFLTAYFVSAFSYYIFELRFLGFKKYFEHSIIK